MKTSTNRPNTITLEKGTKEYNVAICTLTYASNENDAVTFYTMSDELYQIYFERLTAV